MWVVIELNSKIPYLPTGMLSIECFKNYQLIFKK